MSGKEVIRAAAMFTDKGVGSKTSVVKEIVMAVTLGGIFGFAWQTYHWGENKKWDDFYAARKAAKASSA